MPGKPKERDREIDRKTNTNLTTSLLVFITIISSLRVFYEPTDSAKRSRGFKRQAFCQTTEAIQSPQRWPPREWALKWEKGRWRGCHLPEGEFMAVQRSGRCVADTNIALVKLKCPVSRATDDMFGADCRQLQGAKGEHCGDTADAVFQTDQGGRDNIVERGRGLDPATTTTQPPHPPTSPHLPHTHTLTHIHARMHARVHTHVHTHAHTQHTHTHIHTHTHARTHALTHTQTCTHAHKHTHTQSHTRTHTLIRARTRKHTHIHAHTHTHTHVRTHTHTQRHTHTHTQTRRYARTHARKHTHLSLIHI